MKDKQDMIKSLLATLDSAHEYADVFGDEAALYHLIECISVWADIYE